MIRPGELDKRIELQRATPTRGTTGEVLTTWATVSTRWARITPLAGKEFIASQQSAAAGGVTVKMHYDASLAITTRDRLKYGTRIFEINSAVDVDEKHAEYEIRCTEKL